MSKIIKEAAMLFDQPATFDMNPMIFQLNNVVVDLTTNTILAGKPSDMTSRSSPITIPKGWLGGEISGGGNPTPLPGGACRDGRQHIYIYIQRFLFVPLGGWGILGI